MSNIIAILVLLLIVGAAAFYVYKSKKNGQKCIGCPHSCSCSQNNNSCNGCESEK